VSVSGYASAGGGHSDRVRALRRNRFYTGEPDLAAVVGSDAAGIDNRRYPAIALRGEIGAAVSSGGRVHNRHRRGEGHRKPSLPNQTHSVVSSARPTMTMTVTAAARQAIGESMDINGIAHVFLTASNFERARAFYRKLLPFLGMTAVIDSDAVYYCVGGRTGIAIRAPAQEYQGAAFEQNRVGLHHLCFRARERTDVDELHRFLLSIDALIVHAPREDGWAQGYYSLLFEDPDGIRLELNHVPGKGLIG
jgi:catechol 2,3-dioxygenase-like lactoylglutathione lyase family enzyme